MAVAKITYRFCDFCLVTYLFGDVHSAFIPHRGQLKICDLEIKMTEIFASLPFLNSLSSFFSYFELLFIADQGMFMVSKPEMVLAKNTVRTTLFFFDVWKIKFVVMQSLSEITKIVISIANNEERWPLF